MITVVYHKWHIALAALMWCLGSASANAATPDARCHRKAKAKAYKASAECFATLAHSLGAAKRLQQRQRYRKGQWLRNAAILFRRAAKTDRKNATRLRLQAQASLDLYLREKLCETPMRCRKIRALRTTIHKEIGYALVALTTGHPQAKIEIHGMGLRTKANGTLWRGTLPPGEYLVTVMYPKKRSQVRSLRVATGKVNILAIAPQSAAKRRPPPSTVPSLPKHPTPQRRATNEKQTPTHIRKFPRIQPKRNRWPVIVAAVGGGLLISSAIAFIIGKSIEGDASAKSATLRASSTPTPKQSDELINQYERADIAIVAGWITLGLGTGAAITGLISLALRPNKETTPPQVTPEAQGSLLLHKQGAF